MVAVGSRDEERGEGMLSGREIGVGRFFSIQIGGILYGVEGEREMASRVICGESVAGEVERVREKSGYDVWEGEADGVSSMASLGGLL
jgi:hypothetical protein